MNRSLKPKPKLRNELDEIKPIPAAHLTLANLAQYSNKRLLVTAIALNKKAGKEKNPEQREAMLTIAKYIAQLIQGRINEAKLKQGTIL